MSTMPPNSSYEADPKLERVYLEREQNRFAARALLVLVILNGTAALVMLAILASAPESSMDPKFGAAMLFFAGGAIAALLSAFLAYINRTVRIEAPERRSLQTILRLLGILAVIGAGAAFLTGMNMVSDAASERSSSHPKGPKEKIAPPKQDSAPPANAPSSDAPSSDAPSSDAPSNGAPSSDTPRNNAPSNNAPSNHAPLDNETRADAN
ncbi:MAG: hypothetical protein ACM3MH_08545 [Actinomycetota bacterium]